MLRCLKTWYFIPLLVVLFSCKTYEIPVDSFRQQFAAAGHKGRQVRVVGPVGERSRYVTYSLNEIKAIDKAGRTVVLTVSPALETRFFYGNGRHVTFYFDMIRFDGDTIDGGRSRFITSYRKKIPFASVTKIAIQDGGKRFRYAQ